MLLEVESLIMKRFEDKIQSIDRVSKEDLDLVGSNKLQNVSSDDHILPPFVYLSLFNFLAEEPSCRIETPSDKNFISNHQ